ncbi:hypothetical protein, partial [Mycobacterium marinum]
DPGCRWRRRPDIRRTRVTRLAR